MVSVADLDELMRLGWLARSEIEVDGWIARLSEGVTQRANSVLPVAAPADLHNAVTRVEKLYLDHGQAPTFQISPAAQPEPLDDLLAWRRYELQSPTVVKVAVIEDVLRRIPRSALEVEVLGLPDTGWMDLWWAVDGRGDSDARAVAYDILTSGPALYASIRDESEVAAVGRVALVGEWAGVYCMAVRPDMRRRGHATAILHALLAHAVSRGARRTWLQVLADNKGAHALYERVGFVPSSSYHYRTLLSS